MTNPYARYRTQTAQPEVTKDTENPIPSTEADDRAIEQDQPQELYGGNPTTEESIAIDPRLTVEPEASPEQEAGTRKRKRKSQSEATAKRTKTKLIGTKRRLSTLETAGEPQEEVAPQDNLPPIAEGTRDLDISVAHPGESIENDTGATIVMEDDRDSLIGDGDDVLAATRPEGQKRPGIRKPRKKRKSIGQRRPKRLSTGMSKATKPAKVSILTPERRSSLVDVEDNQAAEDTVPESSKSRSSSPRHPIIRRKPTTKHTAHPAPSNSIPITIYRPSPRSPQSSNRSSPDSTHESAKPLDALLAQHSSSTAITPVDVLAQISRELVTKTSSNRNLSQVSRRTINAYGAELDTRLRSLGQALSTNTALGKRLRGLRAEERKVTKQVKGLKAERKVAGGRMESLRKLSERMKVEQALREIREVARRGWIRIGVPC